jgi:hypothetical protein
MSTKIYDGIRIPKSKIDHFMEWFAESCLAAATDYTQALAGCVKSERIAELAEKYFVGEERRCETLEEFMEKYEKHLRVAMVFDMFIRHSQRCLRGFNIDCWANFFPKGRYYYVVTGWPERDYRSAKAEYPDYVEEYGYWDNTDHPDELTARQWATRRKNWKVATDSFNFSFRRLLLNLIEAKDKLNHGLDEIERRLIESGYLDDNTEFSPCMMAHFALCKEDEDSV